MKRQVKRQISWYYHNDYEKIQHLKELMYDMSPAAPWPKGRMLAMRLKSDLGEDNMSLIEVKKRIIRELEREKTGILAILLL